MLLLASRVAIGGRGAYIFDDRACTFDDRACIIGRRACIFRRRACIFHCHAGVFLDRACSAGRKLRGRRSASAAAGRESRRWTPPRRNAISRTAAAGPQPVAHITRAEAAKAVGA
jgi:hypothetical protein